MDETWIVISVITIIGTVINIQLLNHNWFKRQELKSKYKVKEIRERSKAKLSTRSRSISQEEENNPISSVKGLLNLAKGLDSDQLHDLVDTFTGSSTPESSGDMIESLIQNNPELVQSFIDGFTKGKRNKTTGEFVTQNSDYDQM